MPNIKITIKENRCKGCYLCVSVCPKNVLVKGTDSLNKLGYFIAEATDEDECIGCLNCALMCPDGAIGIYKD